MVRLTPAPQEQDEDISSFWLITYADMVTLLLAFFLLMYSFSVMSQDRQEALVEELRGVVEKKRQDEEKVRAELEETARRIAEQLEKAAAFVESTESEVTVGLSSAVTFESGDAVLSPAAEEALRRAAGILAGLPNAVRIEGHTDDVPVHTGRFRSNWHLSAARAQAVVRVLMREGMDPSRIQVVGYADVKSRAPNATPEGRAQNRRIEIKLIKGTG